MYQWLSRSSRSFNVGKKYDYFRHYQRRAVKTEANHCVFRRHAVSHFSIKTIPNNTRGGRNMQTAIKRDLTPVDHWKPCGRLRPYPRNINTLRSQPKFQWSRTLRFVLPRCPSPTRPNHRFSKSLKVSTWLIQFGLRTAVSFFFGCARIVRSK